MWEADAVSAPQRLSSVSRQQQEADDLSEWSSKDQTENINGQLEIEAYWLEHHYA